MQIQHEVPCTGMWRGNRGAGVARLVQVIPAVPPVVGGFEKCACSRLCPPQGVLGTGSCPRPPAEPRGAQSGTLGLWGAAEVPTWVQPITVQRNHCWVQGRPRVLSSRQDQTPFSSRPDPLRAPCVPAGLI